MLFIVGIIPYGSSHGEVSPMLTVAGFGANDVANSVGTLAAISDALTSGGIAAKAAIPLWVMMVGAVGIARGLTLCGPKLIRTVGSEIAELDQIPACCLALSAAMTEIIAASLGLPDGSTRIAVGAVFGVGFRREYLKKRYSGMVEQSKTDDTSARDQELRPEFNIVSRLIRKAKKHKNDRLVGLDLSVRRLRADPCHSRRAQVVRIPITEIPDSALW